MKTKKIVFWFCGMWAFGLGLRMSIELLVSDGWVHVPRNAGYGVNLWFDFIPLCVLGLLVTIFSTNDIIKGVRKMKSVNEVLPIIKEQVRMGIFEAKEEGVEEFKITRERRFWVWKK